MLTRKTFLADQPAYDPTNYWRGMIWGPTNRLLIDGLERRGFNDKAKLLANETLQLLSQGNTFYEVFNPETAQGMRATHYNGFGTGFYLELNIRKNKK